jgi:hypothetical protein
MTHLVEVLEQVDYPTLGLSLAQTSRGGIEADTLSEAGSELRDLGSNGGAADVEGAGVLMTRGAEAFKERTMAERNMMK